MAGGAQLISSLLGAAVGDPSINTSPAAGAYAYTPDQQLEDLNAHMAKQDEDFVPYNNVDEAQSEGHDIGTTRYHDRNGNDVTDSVKSPSDLLPMQKPNFFQRWFNPGESDRANAMNASFATQPLIAGQAHRTSQYLAAKDFSTVQPAVGSPATSWSPRVGAIATGLNPTMAGIASANMPSLEMGAGLPQEVVKTGINRNFAEQQQATNEAEKAMANRVYGNNTAEPLVTSMRLGAEAPLYSNMATEENARSAMGEPTNRVATQIAGENAQKALANNTIANAPAAGRVEGLKLAGEEGAQPDINREITAKAQSGASMAELERDYLPYLKKQFGNETEARTYLSQFFASPPATSGRVNLSNGTVSPFVTTGTPFSGAGLEDLMKRKVLGGMVDGGSAGMKTMKLSNGNTVSYTPQVSVLGDNSTSPTIATQAKKFIDIPKPIPGWPGFTQSSSGAVYKNGQPATDEETALITKMTREPAQETGPTIPTISTIRHNRTY